eukprot:scaffold69498_cov42-Phaeocystis_antarctica.AAC.1
MAPSCPEPRPASSSQPLEPFRASHFGPIFLHTNPNPNPTNLRESYTSRHATPSLSHLFPPCRHATPADISDAMDPLCLCKSRPVWEGVGRAPPTPRARAATVGELGLQP